MPKDRTRSERGSAIEFHSDSVKLLGPKVDGSYNVTFNIGEYEQVKIAQLLTIPQRTNILVKVEINEEAN